MDKVMIIELIALEVISIYEMGVKKGGDSSCWFFNGIGLFIGFSQPKRRIK
jgi:hypothetical protein